MEATIVFYKGLNQLFLAQCLTMNQDSKPRI